MYDKTTMVIYLTAYVITIVYFVVLGCYMLMQKSNPLLTRGEQAAKLRMTRTVGIAMFVVALEWFLYLPPMLFNFEHDVPLFNILFIIMLMMSTPLIYCVMFAVVQRKANILKWICALGAPFFVLSVWQAIAPPQSDILLYVSAALSIACYLFLLIKFANEYHTYIRRIRSEYSETTSREITWSWICFSAAAIHGILFVVYSFFWSVTLEITYHAFSVVNVGYLCFCICRQRTIDVDIIPETEETAEIEDKQEENVIYINIEQKLQTLCKDKLLFLNPDITLETLALRLSINRTYLGMYFHKRELSFYQYINTLRVEYAYKLMCDSPHLSIRKVSELSGFRSQTTFRKMFHEVMGCLPSELKRQEVIK